MGNFSISHYAAIRVLATSIEVRYVLDLAEVPTFQEIQDSGIVAETGACERGPVPGAQGRDARGRDWCSS